MNMEQLLTQATIASLDRLRRDLIAAPRNRWERRKSKSASDVNRDALSDTRESGDITGTDVKRRTN